MEQDKAKGTQDIFQQVLSGGIPKTPPDATSLDARSMSAAQPMSASLQKRPECCNAANDEKCQSATSSTHTYSITLSARANSASGTVTPMALAVFRLITSSNLAGCSTGMSATLMPWKTLTSCWVITSTKS